MAIVDTGIGRQIQRRPIAPAILEVLVEELGCFSVAHLIAVALALPREGCRVSEGCNRNVRRNGIGSHRLNARGVAPFAISAVFRVNGAHLDIVMLSRLKSCQDVSCTIAVWAVLLIDFDEVLHIIVYANLPSLCGARLFPS